MNKNSKIGVFDSGIGGVTVLKEILKVLPNEDYIYYSDSCNNPYGDKPKEEIIEICRKNVDYLLDKDCKIVVVACNTASAVAIQFLRELYREVMFIGIEPAYKMVHDFNYNDETLVMATKGTIESEKFNVLYNKYDNHKTSLLSCIGLADLIERNEKEKIKIYLKDILSPYKGTVKNVVLGCTHYPLIKQEIEDILGNVNFFEGSHRLAIHLKEVLNKQNLLNESGKSHIEFTDSSQSEDKKLRFFDILYN